MKLSTSEPGLAFSALAHAAFLAAGLLAFSSPTPLPEHEEAIAVDLVDPSTLNQVTQGERKAEKPQPQPRAERQSEVREQKEEGEAKRDTPVPPTRPAELRTAEETVSAPQPPARAAQLPRAEPPREPPPPEPPRRPQLPPPPPTAAAPPPKPELRREELAKLVEEAELAAKAKQAEEEAKAAAAKAKAEAQAKADAAAKAKAEADQRARAEAAAKAKAEEQAKAEAQAKAKADAEAKAAAAEALREKAELAAKIQQAEDEAKAKAKAAAIAKARAEAEAKARRDAELAKSYNADAIDKLLRSKETAQSSGSSAPQVSRTASLGAERGSSQKLSPSLRGQIMGIIQDQLRDCWYKPPALTNARNPVIVEVRLKLNRDGSLAAAPAIANSSADPLFRIAGDSALTASRRCAPLRIPAQFSPYFDDWSSVVVNFDSRDG